MERFPITVAGYLRLQEEVKQLKTVERPTIIQAIAAARELGDLSENAEYHAARERQSFIEGKILDLEDKVARAEVIDPLKLSGEKIKFGATVHLIDEDTDDKFIYSIVGEYEADISKGMISISSPIARGLIGKSQDESAEIVTPKGMRYYAVKKVEYK